MEEWRSIPGFPNYEVSESGIVRNVNGTVLVPFKNGKYDRVSTNHDGVRRKMLVHRLVAFAFLGEPTGPIVRHLDDDQSNNHWTNLAYGTMADNKDDARRNGVSHNGNTYKTHCPQGHPYSEENTSHRDAGNRLWRQCRECQRAGSRRRKREAKARRIRTHADLVAWLRAFEGPGSNGANEAADVIEALVTENERIRAAGQ